MLELIYRLRRALNPAQAHREDVLRAVAQGQEQAQIAAFARETQRLRAEKAAELAKNNDITWGGKYAN